MKKVVRAVLTLMLVLSMFVSSVYAAPSTSSLKNQKDKAEAEVKNLQDELTSIMTQMNDTERKLIEKGEEIIAVTEQLEQAEEDEQRQYENMKHRIVVMYENGSGSALEMILESGSILEFIQRMENIQTLHKYDRNELEEYKAKKEEITKLKVTLESERKELSSLQTQLVAQEASLNNKIKAKKAEIKDFEKKIEEAARKAAEEAARKAAEEAAKNNQNVVIGGSNSGGGRDYVGTGNQSVGNAIVAAARSYIGVWYLWGGNDRNGIDCSGLTKACHKSVGITIDRWSGHQAIGGKAIGSLEEALPGDIICYPGHVAIYIGNYRVIHAPCTGKKVQEASVYLGGSKPITAIRRYW